MDNGFQRRKLNLKEFHDQAQEMVTEWKIRRLIVTSKRADDVSNALAWDDFTGMSLDAGNVKGARAT